MNESSANNVHFIDALYWLALARAADAPGKTYWSDKYTAGMASSVIVESFLDSAEYQARYHDISNAQFIDSVEANWGGKFGSPRKLGWISALDSESTSRSTLLKSVVDFVTTAQAMAEQTLLQASAADTAGTYGVGGVLVDNASGHIFRAQRNQVVDQLHTLDGKGSHVVLDPTNHGETQIVEWYYANREKLQLPDPSQLTVVTSLDPCAMCTGSLTTAGFNVAVVAPDALAGINWNDQFDFPLVDGLIKHKIQATFGYYAVSGAQGSRADYMGSASVVFSDQKIDAPVYIGNSVAFEANAAAVRASLGGGLTPQQMTDPEGLPTTSDLRAAFAVACDKAFSIKLADHVPGTSSYRPTIELYDLLRDLKSNTAGADNAVALIDPFGNLLLASADTFAVSPIATAFMNVVQDYSSIRFNLLDRASSTSIDPTFYEQSDAYKALTSLKYCTFVFLKAPDATLTTTLKDLGVYGTTMGAPAPDSVSFQFIEAPSQGTAEQLLSTVRALPPIYWDIHKISPTQTFIPALDVVVSNLSDSGPGSFRAAIDQVNVDALNHRIVFNVSGTITLASDLPQIRKSVFIDATTAPGHLDNQAPVVEINANGHHGLAFSSSANGSTVKGLSLTGSSGYALDLHAGGITSLDTIVGIGIDGSSNPNRLGGVHLADGSHSNSIEGWVAQGFQRSPEIGNNRLIVSGAEPSEVSVVRTDSSAVNVSFKLKTASGKIVDALNFAVPASIDALTPEKLLDGSTAWTRSGQHNQGSQSQISLESGQYTFVATGDYGRDFSLTSIVESGNGLLASFTDAGTTVSATFTFGGIGTNGNLQRGEVSAMISRTTGLNDTIALYEVSNPITGTISFNGRTVSPGDVDYLKDAFELARSANLVFAASDLPSLGSTKSVALPTLDPSKAHGVLLLADGSANTIYSSYLPMGTTEKSHFMSLPLANGSVAMGIENGPIVGNVDFSDWIVVLKSPPTGAGYVGDVIVPTFLSDTSDAMFVAHLYSAALSRTADAAGLNYWLNQLAGGGDRLRVVADFLTSGEYVQRNASSNQYVQSVYFDLLGRDPDPAGNAYWTRELDMGLSKTAFVDALLHSHEFSQLVGIAGH